MDSSFHLLLQIHEHINMHLFHFLFPFYKQIMNKVWEVCIFVFFNIFVLIDGKKDKFQIPKNRFIWQTKNEELKFL